jgi:hypothetical protein
MMRGIKASNIEIEVKGCKRYAPTLSFYMISGNNLSSRTHGGKGCWGHFKASQIEKDVSALR